MFGVSGLTEPLALFEAAFATDRVAHFSLSCQIQLIKLKVPALFIALILLEFFQNFTLILFSAR